MHVGLLLGLSALLATGLASLLWLGLGRPDPVGPLPQPTAPSVSPSAAPTGPPVRRPLTASERLDSIKLVLAVIAGVGGIVALTVAYRRQRQGEAAEDRESTKGI